MANLTIRAIKTIVVVGNPVDGFSFYGPFFDDLEAFEWADKNLKDNWWTATLADSETSEIAQ